MLSSGGEQLSHNLLICDALIIYYLKIKKIRALWDLGIKLYNQQIKREHMLANKKGAVIITYDEMWMLFLTDGMVPHVSVL